MDKENLNLDCWAIVELFGHQRIAGHVTTQLFGVAVMLRVDVPEFTHKRQDWDYTTARDPQRIEVVVTTPAYTRYFGAGAIYAINPSTEELVRKMLHRMDAPPDICLDMQRKALPAGEQKSEASSQQTGGGKGIESFLRIPGYDEVRSHEAMLVKDAQETESDLGRCEDCGKALGDAQRR